MSDDIPSDFFDDFNKDEFMDGLSVIDSWDDQPDRKRISNLSEVLDSVDDLRELIREKDDYEEMELDTSRKKSHVRSKSRDPRDDYIKPGSRRDPSKTYAAIRKDKEVKVKEILAKKLHSSDDLKPPGTELDDFYEEKVRKRKIEYAASKEHEFQSYSRYSDRDIKDRRDKEHDRTRDKERERYRERHREFYMEHDLEPRYSRRNFYPQQRSPYRLNNRSPHRSPIRMRHSPSYGGNRRFSPQRSPARHSPKRSSPKRHSPYYHPRSAPRSPRSSRHSRSSERVRRRHSPYNQNTDNFLYPEPNYGRDYISAAHYAGSNPVYNGPPVTEYSAPTPGYSYTHTPAYTPSFPAQYEYHVPTPVSAPAPQPVPAPLGLPSEGQLPVPQVNIAAAANTVKIPAVEVMKTTAMSSSSLVNPRTDFKTPFDALAQLVAEGKLSKEDYLKLAPNKGTGSGMDTKNRIAVLNRCQEALSKLEKFTLPTHLVMNSNIVGSDPKPLPPQFCSPLKRRAAVEFHFTKQYGSKEQQNRQLIESITETIGLSKTPAKKKVSRDMKDAAVQTTKPFCEVCEIRESTKVYDVGTSVDHEHFYTSVHTQVVDHDLASSKAIFNPSGSSSESRPMSIAHMTPAQLVSQLAARAKTLKQTSEPSGSYDRRQYEHHQNQQSYHNYNNYRY